MSRQIDGTKNQLISTKTQLKIRADQSKLPVQNILLGNNDANKQMNYRNDQRNPRLVVNLQYRGNNNKIINKQICFRKNMAATLFTTLEKIQDDINSYM